MNSGSVKERDAVTQMLWGSLPVMTLLGPVGVNRSTPVHRESVRQGLDGD